MLQRDLCAGVLLTLNLILLPLNGNAQIDWPELTYTQIATGARFPVSVESPLDGSGRMFVVEQPGRILVTASNGFAAAPFLDISTLTAYHPNTEEGLLGLAFPPDYQASGRFYVYYTRAEDLASVLSRFTVSTNSNEADAGSEEQILVIPEVTPTLNAGMLVFGADGYLYLTTGDNGYDFNVISSAQDTSSLWGKMLRIDVSGSTGYGIPPSNPFSGRPGYSPEIWAMGLRNPWRFCFDRANGDLYISDVGQFIAEEIDYEPAPSAGGRNYGWRAREGFHTFFADEANPSIPMTDPILQVNHGLITKSMAISGGFVYRGPSQPRMNGMYFYGDFYSGLVNGLIRSNGVWVTAPVLPTHFLLSAFGEDQSGNLYVADYISGGLFRLTDSGRALVPQLSPVGPTNQLGSVTITTLTPSATIHYTTNGIDPTTSDSSIPSGGNVTITSGTTLKGCAFRAGLQLSGVASNTYVLQAAKPQFSPAVGPATNNMPVTITSSTPSASIRYTLDGTEPTNTSTLYSAAVLFVTNQTLKARAFRPGFIDSDVGTFHSASLNLQAYVPGGFGNNYAVTWSSMTGQTYRVQYSPDFTYWFDIISNLTATGPSMGFTNVMPLSNPRQGFLRVVGQ